MTPEQETMYQLRGLVCSFPEEHKIKILECRQEIIALRQKYEEDAWTIAVALTGAELAALA